MRIKPTNLVPPFTYICTECRRSREAKPGHPVYADLDGKPFEAYYCASCYEKMTAEKESGR